MVCHNIELRVSVTDASGNQITDWQQKADTVRTWVDNHQEVLQQQAAEMSLNDDPTDGGTPHAYASFRFHWDEDPVALKDNVATWLNNNFEWWRVLYHECDHDENQSSRTGCSWNNQWDGGTVPSDIPSM